MVQVDSNVLLDVITADPIWSGWSAEALQRHLDAGPAAINAIVYAEIAFAVERIEDVDNLLPSHLYRYLAIPREASFLAARAHAADQERGGQRPGLPRAHADQPRPRRHRAGRSRRRLRHVIQQLVGGDYHPKPAKV